MSDVVMAALIGAVASVIVNIINNWQVSKKRAVEDAVRETNLQNRLNNIEGKLTTHNNYAEKITEIQMSVAQIQKDIEYLGKAG